MALKVSQMVIFILLWLSLLLLLFHEFHNLKSKINNKQIPTTTTTTISYSPLSRHPLISRKVLASKFDFTPFVKHHQPHTGTHHRKPSPNAHVQPEPAESEIDPRYGVEKRRVPTGPNPLHH
ncbi:CLAVATA3/ESR (CLE)-related protein 12-like [Alnus glutinosa]|uniref:CLAVATA3/ESR (CLE)-related protein 12-like n=1 Tax=Alnus glutinosa TaxID=3517 RepID=UPI002D7783D1|nr:CLAVATA3/ESR (CLE)-related protein 12-like [Alnus glutinosa]